MKLGMNHPMGPLALADFIGLDVCLAILEVLHARPRRRQVPPVPAAPEDGRGRAPRPEERPRLLRLPLVPARPIGVRRMDFELTEDQSALRDVARDFAARRLRAGRRGARPEGGVPRRARPEGGRARPLGLLVPEAYGGSGLGNLALCLALDRDHRADASVGVTLSVHNSLCSLLHRTRGRARSRRRGTCRGSRRASGSAPTRSPRPAAAPTPARSRARPRARATTSSSTARSSGSRAATRPTSSSSSRAPAGAGERRASRRSSSRPRRPASRSGRRRRRWGSAARRRWSSASTRLPRPRRQRARRAQRGLPDRARDTLDGGRIGIASQARRHRAGVPRRVDQVRQGAQAVRPAHRASSRRSSGRSPRWRRASTRRACSATARPSLRDAGPAAHAARRRWRSSRRRAAANFCAKEAVQIHGGAGYTQRVPRRALLPRRARHRDLRGHDRDPEARDRALAPARTDRDGALGPRRRRRDRVRRRPARRSPARSPSSRTTRRGGPSVSSTALSGDDGRAHRDRRHRPARRRQVDARRRARRTPGARPGRRVGVARRRPDEPVHGRRAARRPRPDDAPRRRRGRLRPLARDAAARSGGLSRAAHDAADVLDAAGFDPVVIETVGVGQGEVDVARAADTVVVVLAPGAGDDVQAMKAGLLEVADVLVVNQADRDGAEGLVRALEAALDRSAPAAFRPPVVTTRATEGAMPLRAALDAHAKRLAEGSRLAERRRQRARAAAPDARRGPPRRAAPRREGRASDDTRGGGRLEAPLAPRSRAQYRGGDPPMTARSPRAPRPPPGTADPRAGREGRPRRPRPRREGRRGGAPRRGLRGDLHGPAADAGDDRRRPRSQEDVDAIGLSLHSGAHMTLFPRVLELL